MKQSCKAFAVAAVVTVGAWTSQAMAAPPTVTPSPGYDARLQEQRAAAAHSAPAGSVFQPVYQRHHARRVHRSPAAPRLRNSESR
jgi:hypothetical protein